MFSKFKREILESRVQCYISGNAKKIFLNKTNVSALSFSLCSGEKIYISSGITRVVDAVYVLIDLMYTDVSASRKSIHGDLHAIRRRAIIT